jgi:hypothetical protein
VPQLLDAGAIPPVGVATPQMIAVHIGTTPRQLLIFTGVAIPNWDSQHLAPDERSTEALAPSQCRFPRAATVVKKDKNAVLMPQNAFGILSPENILNFGSEGSRAC